MKKSTDARHLSQFLESASARRPSAVAVEDDRGRILTYGELADVADRLSARLARWGVDRGDRVGLFLPKCLESVGAIHGILRAGAAYVPVDASSSPSRGAGILADCAVRAVVVSAALAPALRDHWPGPGPLPRMVIVGDGQLSAGDASWADILDDDAPSPLLPKRLADDPAYILYTSGSTGRPKGVTLSHANALCFLDWCAATFDLRESDRFASHAPFHFDLSTFDLFASCRSAATLVLIGESTGRDPSRLGEFLATGRIDVWYSAPSILSLLVDHAAIDAPEFRAPRLVLFAGEVFPIRSLKRLRRAWPDSSLWNLYGPTETNVCTAMQVPDLIPDDRFEPYPIGRVCPPLTSRVVDDQGRDVPPGSLGELLISGPGVTRGYFGRPDLTTLAFLVDEHGTRWYRTGDLVETDESGDLVFRGRRDRMVKKRGYRIELGEIESALHKHEDVESAAVVAKPGEEGVTIAAFVAMKPGRRASIIAMKKHCTTYLPHYMIPDRVTFVGQMPRTSTDKVDYVGLTGTAAGAREGSSLVSARRGGFSPPPVEGEGGHPAGADE